MNADEIIHKLNLEAHPEGGYFKETYRSSGFVSKDNLGTEYSGDRNYSTAIYFLLKSGEFSAFHKIHQDEGWHFYSGSPITIHMLHPDGGYEAVTLHNELDNGFEPQFVVPGGSWFAAEVIVPESFALVGCTVSPGFDFRDFEMAKRDTLEGMYPDQKEIISRLCL